VSRYAARVDCDEKGPTNYFITSNHIAGAAVPPNAKLVYVMLCCTSNATCRASAGIQTLADMTGLEARSVARAIKHLLESGIVERARVGHRGTVSEYVLRNPGQFSAGMGTKNVGHSGAGMGTKNVGHSGANGYQKCTPSKKEPKAKKSDRQTEAPQRPVEEMMPLVRGAAEALSLGNGTPPAINVRGTAAYGWRRYAECRLHEGHTPDDLLAVTTWARRRIDDGDTFPKLRDPLYLWDRNHFPAHLANARSGNTRRGREVEDISDGITHEAYLAKLRAIGVSP
jgi:hypothetical protein